MEPPEAIQLTVGPKGRLLLPVALRRRLGIEPGSVLLARAEDDRLVLERRTSVLARLRSRYRVASPEVSLADDLRAERAEEAERESGA